MKTPPQPSCEAVALDEADAREFDAFARSQDAVLLQAALWATRRSEGGLDTSAEAEFQTWLGAHPEHPKASAEMDASLDSVQYLPQNKIHALKAGLSARPLPSPTKWLADDTPSVASDSLVVSRPGRPTSLSRRTWLTSLGSLLPQAAMAMAIMALTGGGWLGWDHYRALPTFSKEYVTQRGQRLNVELPDGSTLQLDVATQAQVSLYRDRREVHLQEGQAMFAVAADPAQPFTVLTGPTRVTVIGTRFSVRHVRSGWDAGNTVVAVESGRVSVARVASADSTVRDIETEKVELTAGQSVTADLLGQLQPVASIPSQSVALWRKGRISFNDTPLSDALAELERYGNTGLVVHDPAVGALRLGGSVDLLQVGVFAHALPSLLPVRLEKKNGQVEVLSAR